GVRGDGERAAAVGRRDAGRAERGVHAGRQAAHRQLDRAVEAIGRGDGGLGGDAVGLHHRNRGRNQGELESRRGHVDRDPALGDERAAARIGGGADQGHRVGTRGQGGGHRQGDVALRGGAGQRGRRETGGQAAGQAAGGQRHRAAEAVGR